MKYQAEFRDRELIAPLLEELHRLVNKPVRIMEVCGTHTVSIFRSGLRSLLPPDLELVSGPGCPVCVTPAGHIDACIEAAGRPKVITATFGDLIRVPGSHGSLADIRAQGARVEPVYSPMDALLLAGDHPDRTIFFPAIGFETTAPTIAATLLEAERLQLDNLVIFPGCKIMPPPLHALLSSPDLLLDGLLCPGHVSAIIGADAFRPLAEQYTLPCAVAGFEPADILSGLLSLVRRRLQGRAGVDNCYSRVVSDSGNTKARSLMAEVFVPEDTPWRGLGMIPDSGLGLRPRFARFDARPRLDLAPVDVPEPVGCACGNILQGHSQPPSCPLYGTTCTPSYPVGPCMVSSEGTCAAWYRYGGSLNTDCG